jgi:AmiR/NasT family two-component response regulator
VVPRSSAFDVLTSGGGEAQRTDHLRAALVHRDVIGEAEGIIMERYQINSHAAFSTLSRISQARNIKLHEVARQIAETGELPHAPEH